MSRARRAAVALGPALLATALWLGACGSDEARASVSYYDAPTLPRTLLAVTVSDGGSARRLTSAEIGANGRPAAELATRQSGTLSVAFRFADGAATIAEGSAEVPLRSDWAYGFTIHVDSANPRRTCFGCIGSTPFPLLARYRRTPADSVWLVWGGNSIRHPVVY